jgi:hypothetical protein
MSVPARIVLVVLLVALVGMGGAYWWVTRPTPEPELVGEVRVLTVDPDVELPVLLEIPTDPNGCPGYTVSAPGESMFTPTVGPDGSRSDWTINLGGGVALLSVCFGPVSEVGDLDDFLDRRSIEKDLYEELLGAVEQVGAIDEIRSAHGDGPARTTRFGEVLVTDFFVEHDGFIHGVGYMRPESVGDAYLPIVEAMLASWSWD